MSQFYTPQARRGFPNSQKPLATIDGPASRFFQGASSSSPMMAPGSLGKPQRILAPVDPVVEPVQSTPAQQRAVYFPRAPMSEVLTCHPLPDMRLPDS